MRERRRADFAFCIIAAVMILLYGCQPKVVEGMPVLRGDKTPTHADK